MLVNSTLFGSVATYDCFDGFELSSEDDRVCDADGLWSDDQPSCEAQGKGKEKVVVTVPPMRCTMTIAIVLSYLIA